MSRIARSGLASVVAGTLFLLAPAALVQLPGEVLWNQKISAARGQGPRAIKSFDQFGRGSAVIGDLDGDGVVDLVVGATGDDDSLTPNSTDYGGLWILFMQRDGKVKSFKEITRTSAALPLDPGDEFGRTVRELGDFDLDGIPDILVGANYDDDGGTDQGALYLLFMNRDGTVKSWKKISQTSGGFTADLDTDDQFGRGARCIGDLDKDGVPDIGVGAIRDDDGGSNRGCYYILFMKRDGTVKGWNKMSETKGNFQSSLSDWGEFGFDCTVLGDRNGDGVQDIAISSPDQTTSGQQQGAVFIVFMNTNGTAKSDFRIAENYSNFNGNMLDYNDEFGCCIDTIGDLDNDGNVDIAVGVGKDDDGPTGSVDRGAIYIMFLKADCTVRAWQKISRSAGRFDGEIDSQDRFGTALACPGDLNGDGIEDLFAGTRFDDDGGSGAGCVYFLALNDGRFVPPTADFTGDPRRGPAPLTVNFSDQSTGTVTNWSWNFGDGATSTEENPQHVYTTPNNYNVSLKAKGPAGESTVVFTTVIKVDPALRPTAIATGGPLNGTAPLPVQFADQSAGWITGRSWDFGDGATSTDPTPTHVYVSGGSFTAALTVTGPGGAHTTTVGPIVVAATPPPVAEFSASNQSGPALLAVQFADLSSGLISTRSWDFGDGATSALANPTHTYASTGSFTVALSVTGPGGIDVETKLGFVTVDVPPAPVADLAGAPTSGQAPLTVGFSDLSSGGPATNWLWTFGDGKTSSLQHPTHVYAEPGTYSVTLAVSGPGGQDERVAADLVTVQDVRRGLADPSFEAQLAGGHPSGPWRNLFGEHEVEPSGAWTKDGTLPTQGAQWLVLSADGTVGALPPSVPRGLSLPPQGGAGVAQSFYIAQPFFKLEFDAAFVRGEAASDAAANDWMSIDVSDGTTSANLYYADTFTAAPGLSTALGLPMTAVSAISADLRTFFPGANEQTLFELTIQVGNGGDGESPSFGLVDDFLFAQAPGTVLRYGCGVNPTGSLTVISGTPRVGTTMIFGIDNPLGTQGTNSSTTLLMSFKPDLAFPCGTLTPNVGMGGAGQSGEWLINRTAPDPVKTVAGSKWSTPGVAGRANLPIPVSASLIGLPLYVQGFILDSRQTFGVRVGLTDAFKLVVGP